MQFDFNLGLAEVIGKTDAQRPRRACHACAPKTFLFGNVASEVRL